MSKDLHDRVAEKSRYVGEFLDVKFVFRPAWVHGAHLKPREADWSLVAEGSATSAKNRATS